jgi:hypothetical protein
MADTIPFTFPGPLSAGDKIKGGMPFEVTLSRQLDVESGLLEKNFNTAVGKVIRILEGATTLSDRYEVDQLKLSLSIDSEGSVSIGPLASGGISGSVSIEVTIRKKA